jgi:hypothetical protein
MELLGILIAVFSIPFVIIVIRLLEQHRGALLWKTAVEKRVPSKIYGKDESTGFKLLFWIHQGIVGLPAMSIGADLLLKGKSEGIINAIGLLLAWIGGTLVWGLAALMHRRPVYELPPAFAAVVTNIARLESMQTHSGGVSAVADAMNVRP